MNNIPLYLDDDQIDEYSSSFKRGWKKLVKVLRYRERHPDVAQQLNWLNQKRINRAIEHFQKCVAAYPRSWSSMWGLGKAHQAIGDHCTALQWFEKVYHLKPDLVDVPLEASTEAMRIGDAQKGLQYAKLALTVDRRNPNYHANLALAWLLNQDLDLALEEAKKAVKLDPDSKKIQNVDCYIKKFLMVKDNLPPVIDPVRVFREKL